MITPTRTTAVLAAAAILALGSCAGTSGGLPTGDGPVTAEQGVAYALAQVEKFSKPAGLVPPAGPPIDGVDSLAGETVWLISYSNRIPYFASVAEGVAEAAEATGLKLQGCDGEANPVIIAACVEKAINAGAAGVIGNGIIEGMIQPGPESTIKAGLTSLREAGIPFVEGNQRQQVGGELIGFVSNNIELQTALAADWIIADSGGTANVLAVRHTDSAVNRGYMDDGGLLELTTYCPGCKVTVVDTEHNLQGELAASVRAALDADSDIDYILAGYGVDVPIIVPVLDRDSEIKIASTTAQLPNLQSIRDGEAQRADAGSNPIYIGWAQVDQILRLMLGEDPMAEFLIPVRLFTPDNIDSLDLSPEAYASGAWYGSEGYVETFLESWGK